MSLPISCKYQKNECPVVLQDREHLSYHEEDCECRDGLCPYQFCEESIPANQFKNHSREKHEFSVKENSHTITKMSESEKKLVQDDWYDVEVKIKDLKAELNTDEDSQIPMSDEDD